VPGVAEGSAPPFDGPDRRRFLLGALGAAAGLGLAPMLAACSDDDQGSSPRSTSTTTGGSSTTGPGGGGGVADLREAFFAGLPLLTTYRTLQTFAPITGINHVFASPGLTNATTRLVVAPNHDTVYALAVLDLAAGPVRIALPDIPDRYHVIQVIDAWMGGVALLGTRTTGGRSGSWVVAPPDAGPNPPGGGEVVRCPTRHAFVLGRLRAVDDADAGVASAVAHSIRIEPVMLGGGPAPPPGALPRTAPLPLGPPLGPPQTVGEDGAAFFDELGDVLVQEEPVTAAQRKALAAVADLVGPGRHPTTEHPDRRADLAEAVDSGLAQLAQGLDAAADLHNGWRVNLNLGTGDDRQSLAERALIAKYFWGPVPAEEAVYPKAVTADDGQPLDGSKRYRIRLAGDDLPPVDAFWSFTVYAEDLFFYPNPLDRYSLSGDTPGLVRDADGSIELALQHADPASAGTNWLPVPDGPFHLVMRLYLPRPPVLEGTWDYPPVQVVT
jgi:hypothetical protein